MKSFTVMLVLLALAVFNASAQKQTHNLLISVYDQDYTFSKTREQIIVSKDDGSQTDTTISVSSTAFQPNHIKDKESSVMAMLSPYFKNGWKLVTSNTIVLGSNGSTMLTRYFLRKEE